MAVQLYEHYTSGAETISLDSPTAERVFMALRSENPLEVRLAVETSLPTVWRGLIFQDYSISHEGGGVWTVTATWGQMDPRGGGSLNPQVGSGTGADNNLPDKSEQPGGDSDTLFKFTFDTTGGTTHITQAQGTTFKYPAAGFVAPDFHGAIGVEHDKDSVEVKGTDIVVPEFKWTETHYVPLRNVTKTWVKQVFKMTGTVNDAPFRFFETGECLFMGVSGSRYNLQVAELNFTFAGQPNIHSGELKVGEITLIIDPPDPENPDNIVKYGWEYLWIYYGEHKDEEAKRIIKRPKAVYVEGVYKYTDFTLLGIGG